MDFKSLWETFFGMVKLEDKSYTTAAKAGFTAALINFVLVSVAMGIGQFWMNFNVVELILTAIVGTIFITIVWFIAVGIQWVIAKILGGKGDYMEQYVSSSYLTLFNLLYIIPVLGPIVATIGSIWTIVMNVVLIRNVHSLSTGKAVVVVLIPLILAIIIGILAAAAIIALIATIGLA